MSDLPKRTSPDFTPVMELITGTLARSASRTRATCCLGLGQPVQRADHSESPDAHAVRRLSISGIARGDSDLAA